MLGETLPSTISTRAPGFQSQPIESLAADGAATIAPEPPLAGCQSGSEASIGDVACCVRVTRRTKPLRSVAQRSAPAVQAIAPPSGDHAGRSVKLPGPTSVYVTWCAPLPSAPATHTCPPESRNASERPSGDHDGPPFVFTPGSGSGVGVPPAAGIV